MPKRSFLFVVSVLLSLFITLTMRSKVRADAGPIVAVSGGQIRGTALQKGGAVFKGIRYAQPPVGDLRWREPMPLKPWSGVRDATAFGAICAQASRLVPNAAEISNEDCLFLNVWTPEWPSKSRKAVMVWIPGGGNFSGGSNGVDAALSLKDGESLARHGVVLVTINYRLGSFGFFSLPALTRESPHHASGNQGILDQIAALKWVRGNIANFGGDPDNVTIFGESAGSLDVSALMTTPLSRGLFQRVIGDSGSVVLVGDPLTLQQAEKRGKMLAAGWKVSPDSSTKDLQAVPTATILKAEPNYLVGLSTTFPNLGITIDGYVFPKKPAEVFAAGQEQRVAFIHGSNSRERVPGTTPPDDLEAAIKAAYGPIADQALKLYLGDADPLYGTPAEQWATDTSFRCSAVAQLVWHAAAGNTAFEYEFGRVPPGREAVGSSHASELPYVFGEFDAGIFRPEARGGRATATALDSQISEAMQQYWTNFAKTGNPNGGNLPKWPKFGVSTRAYLQFTKTEPVVKEGLRRPFCNLFMENLKRQMAN